MATTSRKLVAEFDDTFMLVFLAVGAAVFCIAAEIGVGGSGGSGGVRSGGVGAGSGAGSGSLWRSASSFSASRMPLARSQARTSILP